MMDIIIAIIIGVIVGVPMGFIMGKYYKFIMIKIFRCRPKFEEFHFKPTENDDYIINLRNDRINETFSLFFIGKNGKRVKYKNNKFVYSYWDLIWKTDKDIFIFDLIKNKKGINELISDHIAWNPKPCFQSATDGIDKALNE